MNTDGVSNLWLCPSTDVWWCGRSPETTACQTGINASFVGYTAGSILGFPPLTLSPSAQINSPSNPVTATISAGPTSKATAVMASSSVKMSTGSLVPAQTQGQLTRLPTGSSVPVETEAPSTSLPIAIGVEIGVPLGIATVSFLGFNFGKEAMRQRRTKPRTLRKSGLDNDGQFAAATIDGQWTELPEAQLPRELDGHGRTELSSL